MINYKHLEKQTGWIFSLRQQLKYSILTWTTQREKQQFPANMSWDLGQSAQKTTEQ